jgi:DNA ligase (NAD+)
MAKSEVQIKALINDIFLFGDGSFDQFSNSDLFELLQAADNGYYNVTDQIQVILTDEQYDALHQYCAVVDPTNVYFLGVGSGVRGGKVKLPYTMGSLTQAYIGGDLQKWVNDYNLSNADLQVTEKLDGISTLLVYDADGKLQIAYSRGDGIEGADITRHVSKITDLPQKVNGAMVVRAEIIFSKKNWETIKTQIKRSGGAFYKNARNATAGLMNASESDPLAYKYLSVVAYEILGIDMHKEIQLDALNGNGFTIPKGDIFTGHLMTDVYMTDYLNKLRDNSEYEIDGVVIEVCETNLRKKINPTKNTLNPEYARKFKVADASNLAVAEVIEVEWNISKNGYLKPRVRIQPTELVGVTVKHATGFNAAFILNNGIGPGAKIRITRSGDVIPFILGVVESVAPQMPEEEDVRWTVNNKGEKVDLVLEDLNNETVQLEQMIDFFGKVGTEYLGEGNLKTIFDAGFTTIQDAINLSEGEWVNMIGANGKKIHKSIREKLTNIPWYIVAGAHPAFGRGVGVRKMKKLYDAFAGDMNLLNSVSAMVAVEGFDEKTATKISSGFTTFLIFRNETGIKFAEYEAPKGGDLSGQSFLFTGFRDKGLEKKIEEKGGKNSSAVSSKLTYLVALDPNEDSGKLKKARDLGTKIITRDQLMEILK